MTRIASLLIALLLLTGCHETWEWSVTITTTADQSSTYIGNEVGLTAFIHAHNTDVWVDVEDWDVVTAPGAYTLGDHGRDAEFTGMAVGDYVLRYRVWYWADDGYYYRQDSFVTVSVLAAFAG